MARYLEKMAALEPTIAYPGHGEPITDPLELIRTTAGVPGVAVGLAVALVLVWSRGLLRGTPLTRVSNPCGLFELVGAVPTNVEHCVREWQALTTDPLLEALRGRDAVPLEVVARGAGLEAPEALGRLVVLEAQGRVRSLAGGLWALA